VDRTLIDANEARAAVLRDAVAGLTREDLTARPGPVEWSVLEVVVHLADSDCITIDRMKRILVEDEPPLLLLAALKDGTLSEDETKAMIVERDAVIERIIAKTAATTD
jgi:hypothetical protein